MAALKFLKLMTSMNCGRASALRGIVLKLSERRDLPLHREQIGAHLAALGAAIWHRLKMDAELFRPHLQQGDRVVQPLHVISPWSLQLKHW